MNISLRDLAGRHAKERLTKKERNADLRRHGFDPDGEDGAKYRRLFQAAVFGEFAGGVADEQSAAHDDRPKYVALWDLPKSEFAAWIAHCDGSGTWVEYQARLAATCEHLYAQGHAVRTVRATVAEMLAAIEKLGQPNTTAGRAATLAILAEAKGN